VEAQPPAERSASPAFALDVLAHAAALDDEPAAMEPAAAEGARADNAGFSALLDIIDSGAKDQDEDDDDDRVESPLERAVMRAKKKTKIERGNLTVAVESNAPTEGATGTGGVEAFCSFVASTPEASSPDGVVDDAFQSQLIGNTVA
jgi:hypothetical protein